MRIQSCGSHEVSIYLLATMNVFRLSLTLNRANDTVQSISNSVYQLHARMNNIEDMLGRIHSQLVPLMMSAQAPADQAYQEPIDNPSMKSSLLSPGKKPADHQPAQLMLQKDPYMRYDKVEERDRDVECVQHCIARGDAEMSYSVLALVLNSSDPGFSIPQYLF